jgi:hypothetical protein
LFLFEPSITQPFVFVLFSESLYMATLLYSQKCYGVTHYHSLCRITLTYTHADRVL